MRILDKKYDRDVKSLFDQLIISVGCPNLKGKWVALPNTGMCQLTYKIGHTFTESPHFPDGIDDVLTNKFHKVLEHLGYAPDLRQASTAAIDRGEGEIIVDIPAEIFETIHDKMNTLRNLAIQHAAETRGKRLHGRH